MTAEAFALMKSSRGLEKQTDSINEAAAASNVLHELEGTLDGAESLRIDVARHLLEMLKKHIEHHYFRA